MSDKLKTLFSVIFIVTISGHAFAQEMETPMSEQTDNSINYIEFPLKDVDATKAFYGKVFGWTFTDWGPDYVSFEGAEVQGGFNGTEPDTVEPQAPGVLVLLYAKDLEKKFEEVKAADGEILKEIFEFPGGKRFHFRDPNGNELAVWSE